MKITYGLGKICGEIFEKFNATFFSSYLTYGVGFPAGLRSRRFLDGVGVGILRVLGVGVGIFDPTPTPKVQLNSFSTCFACLFLLVWPI